MPIAKYYLNDPNAPAPNMPVHYGANAYVVWEGKLLLERRSDCGQWGLIGGGRKPGETDLQTIKRELEEETGLRLPEAAFQREKIYDRPGRIASYRDGSVWQMVIAMFRIDLDRKPELHCSRESTELCFFSREELKTLQIPQTHRDIVEQFIQQG